MARQDFHKIIIGRSEVLDFVDLTLSGVPAKVDTGSYRSAIHAAKITHDAVRNILSFDLLGDHPICGAMHTHIQTDEFIKVWVANSFGHRQERYEVKLKVKIGPKIFKASFTLADRSKKIYPILLGRKLLNNRFVVDSGEANVNRVELKRQYGIEMPNDEEEGRNEDSNSL